MIRRVIIALFILLSPGMALGEGESDTTPPTVTAFTIPATSDSLTVPISTFTATDAVGVTGYCVNESSTPPTSGSCSGSGWAGSAQTQYVFSTEGAKTLYAWAKDAAGNVSSSLNDSVTIMLPEPSELLVLAGGVLAGGGFLGVNTLVNVADDFNRADIDPIGYPWIHTNAGNNFKIVSNMIYGTMWNRNAMYYGGIQFSDNQYAQSMINNESCSASFGVMVRCSPSAETYYLLYANEPTTITLYKMINNAFFSITQYSGVVYGIGSVLRLEASGTTLTSYMDGIPLGSVTDSAISSGSPGLYTYGTNCALDNFAAGDL